MIELHCLWAKSNNRTRGQFECHVTWFCFCFDFDCSHAQCGCCSIICLRYQVVQIKQVDSKMSTKLGLCFLLIDWLSFRERGGEARLKLDVQGQEGERILDVDGQRGWVVLEI